MKKGENSRKDKFLRNFPQLTLGDADSDIALRCKELLKINSTCAVGIVTKQHG